MNSNVKSYVNLLRRLAPEAGRLTLDSRTLRAGDVFIAVPGLHVDGRRYLEQAAQKASALVYEDDGQARHFNVPAIAVPNLKNVLGEFVAEFYRHPSRSLFAVGITGTNGKTTSSHWTAQLFSLLGKPCAAIGTIGCFLEGKPFPSAPLTTPDAATLQGLYHDLSKAGARAFAVEASSIGLEQGRLQGTDFDVAIFTNLTRDHLDYHKSMQAYEQAKAILFDWPGLKSAVINIDDEAGVRMAEKAVHRHLQVFVTSTRMAIPLTGTRLIAAENIQSTVDGIRFDLVYEGQRIPLQLHIFGEFNVSNLLGVVGAALAAGYSLETIASHLGELVPPAGRMQLVKYPHTPLAVIDYSHTPDAIEKALQALRPVARTRRGKLWIVVGAGGDRDHGKRPLMAEKAQAGADEVILTSDNPRTEQPAAILAEMSATLTRPVKIIEDRRAAIKEAMTSSQENDIVLIAGKGHENYQEINGVKHPFSDVIEARNAQWSRRPPSGALMHTAALAKLFPGSSYFGSDVTFTSVSTDTRQTEPGSLFFALKGAKFDAHDFVDQAMQAGAVALVVEHPVHCPLPQIIVRDTKLALGASAAYWRRSKNIPLIAVAGSNGKTTTTQLIASILRAHFGEDMLATQGNLNNDIGVPLMLWKLRDHHRAAVIETGMNHVGEMRYLANLVFPTVAVMTNAQREHQEFLGTVQAAAKENGEIFRAMSESGTAILPFDDPCKDIWIEMAGAANIMTFAQKTSADVTGSMVPSRHGMRAMVKTPRGHFTVELHVQGAHNLNNVLAATAATLAIQIPLESIERGLSQFMPLAGRGAVHAFGENVLIDDAYNANPDSVRAAIDVLAGYPAPRLFVLGDMGELGDKSRAYHEEVGQYAAQKGIEGFFGLGPLSKYAMQQYARFSSGEAFGSEDRDEFFQKVVEVQQKYRSVTIKGSNAMRLNQLVQLLLQKRQPR